MDFTPVTGFSQRLPLMNFRPPEKVLTVSLQLFEQPWHVIALTLCVNSSSASAESSVDVGSSPPFASVFSRAYSAAP